jgi:penicillin-binding protein 1A
VVWVGYDTPATLGNDESGAAVAGPIWHDYMAVALKNRPVLNFTQPPGVTMASWDTGSGMVTDAFKPDQLPGASAPIGANIASQQPAPDGSTPAAAAASTVGHGDMSLGGLY